MAGDAALVAVRIAEVRAVVVLVLVRAKPGRAVTASAMGERDGVRAVDEGAASEVLHAVRHLRKPMDLSAWQGANRSNAPWRCDDFNAARGAKAWFMCRMMAFLAVWDRP
jgi:hypothetical protein